MPIKNRSEIGEAGDQRSRWESEEMPAANSAMPAPSAWAGPCSLGREGVSTGVRKVLFLNPISMQGLACDGLI